MSEIEKNGVPEPCAGKEPPAAGGDAVCKPEQQAAIGSMAAAALSCRGTDHVASGVPCQDSSGCLTLPEQKLLLLATADGVGACRYSDEGSKVAVAAALNYLKRKLTEPLPEKGAERDRWMLEKLLPEAFRTARDTVEDMAEKMQRIPFDVMSTLDLGVFDGSTLWYAHCGDGGIVVLDRSGGFRMVTSRHKGGDEMSSLVDPLQGKESEYEFGKADDIVEVVLATDGVLDSFVRKSDLGNRVYFPFMGQFAQSAMQGSDALFRKVKDTLTNPGLTEHVGDDLTVLVAANVDALKTAARPAWDQEAWERDTRSMEERRNQILYGQPTRNRPAEPAPRHAASPAARQTPRTARSVQTSGGAALPDRPRRTMQSARVCIREVWRGVSGMMDELEEYLCVREEKVHCTFCGEAVWIHLETERQPEYCMFCGKKLN